MHYYHKALNMPPIVADDPRFDLSKEIAYNLAMIYQSSGNHELASQLLYKYIVIWMRSDVVVHSNLFMLDEDWGGTFV